MENVKQYYKELGKVLYAIAMADGIVQPEEQQELHKFVLKELAHHERTYDSSGMNKAFYVDFEFDGLVEEHPKLNGALDNFKRFLDDNMQAGDEGLLQRSLRLMETVANAYNKNREMEILEQLKSITAVYLHPKQNSKGSS